MKETGLVFCFIAAWIQFDISGCQPDFLVVWSWEHFRVYFREHFYRFLWEYKSWENLWNCSRKYTKILKIDSLLGNKKLEFKPECLGWSCHYETGCFVSFWGDISILKSYWNMKKVFCCPALELFIVYPHFFVVYSCGQQWGYYMEKRYKMQQK